MRDCASRHPALDPALNTADEQDAPGSASGEGRLYLLRLDRPWAGRRRTGNALRRAQQGVIVAVHHGGKGFTWYACGVDDEENIVDELLALERTEAIGAAAIHFREEPLLRMASIDDDHGSASFLWHSTTPDYSRSGVERFVIRVRKFLRTTLAPRSESETGGAPHRTCSRKSQRRLWYVAACAPLRIYIAVAQQKCCPQAYGLANLFRRGPMPRAQVRESLRMAADIDGLAYISVADAPMAPTAPADTKRAREAGHVMGKRASRPDAA